MLLELGNALKAGGGSRPLTGSSDVPACGAFSAANSESSQKTVCDRDIVGTPVVDCLAWEFARDLGLGLLGLSLDLRTEGGAKLSGRKNEELDWRRVSARAGGGTYEPYVIIGGIEYEC
jgi:hypothetical protein